MKKLEISLKNKIYTISIGTNILSLAAEFVKSGFLDRKVVVITDKNVNHFYGDRISLAFDNCCKKLDIIVIKAGESSKRLSVAEEIYEKLSELKISRDDLVITFGGGVIGDLGGFVASTYLRGVKYIQIPTTLLAQVDSSIGGKVAVDLACGKNLVGSFYHPEAVFIDSSFLRTLSPRVLHDGLAEVIKYGFIKDREIINLLLNQDNDLSLLDIIDIIIYKCCEIKREIVEEDELDKGNRMLLNFGHTFGHVIESYFKYEKYTHGEAVAIGMVEIVKSGIKTGITKEECLDTLLKVLTKYELPVNRPDMNNNEVLSTMAVDKKNTSNGISLIMLKNIGDSFIYKANKEELEKIFNL